MAIVVIQEIDAPVEQYDQVSEKLGEAREPEIHEVHDLVKS